MITDVGDGSDYWTEERIEASSVYQWGVYRYAATEARSRSANTVLDIGCGAATKLDALFEDFDVYAVDQPGTIEVCRRLGRRGTFAPVDLSEDETSVPFPPCDVVVCSDVIEHVQDPMTVLSFVRRSCAGVAVISTPDRDRMGREAANGPTNPAHVREWSTVEFRGLVEAGGFEVLDHRTMLPFRPGANQMTVRWLVDAVRRRSALRTNQVVLARPR